MNKKIVVNDKMQKNYTYYLTQPMGQNFSSMFHPQLTPQEMLEMGVFWGKYMTDCQKEFPLSWFKNAKLSPKKESKNKFFQSKRVAVIKNSTRKMTNIFWRSERVVPTILQILYVKKMTRRWTSDQTSKSYDETCQSHQK